MNGFNQQKRWSGSLWKRVASRKICKCLCLWNIAKINIEPVLKDNFLCIFWTWTLNLSNGGTTCLLWSVNTCAVKWKAGRSAASGNQTHGLQHPHSSVRSFLQIYKTKRCMVSLDTSDRRLTQMTWGVRQGQNTSVIEITLHCTQMESQWKRCFPWIFTERPKQPRGGGGVIVITVVSSR